MCILGDGRAGKQFFLSSPENLLIDFRERERDGKKEGEKHLCERETSSG